MAGEAAVSDPIGLALAWAASLASIAVAVVAAGHAGVYKRDEQSATPWGLLISGGHCPPARWPSVRVTARPICSPDPLATRLSRNKAHGWVTRAGN